MISIAVVIPTYNHGEYILEAIDSVIRQTFNDWQLIIVDNNSSDTTIQNIQSKYTKFLKSGKIIIKNFDKTVHVMQNFNRCLNLIPSCKYFKFLCSDDILEPNYLEVAYSKMEKLSKSFVAYGCSIKNFNDENDSISIRYYGKYFFNLLLESIFYKNQIGCPSSVFLRFSEYSEFRFDENNNYSGDLMFFIKPLLNNKNNKIFIDKVSLVRVRVHNKTNTSKNFMGKSFFKERYSARLDVLSYFGLNKYLIYFICNLFYFLEYIYSIFYKYICFKKSK